MIGFSTLSGSCYPARDGSARVLAAFGPDESPDRTERLYVLGKAPAGSAFPFPQSGSVEVYAKLTPAQVRWIAAHGVPIELERAMLDACDQHGWKPPKPMTMGGSVTFGAADGSFVIDPAPWVPALNTER